MPKFFIIVLKLVNFSISGTLSHYKASSYVRKDGVFDCRISNEYVEALCIKKHSNLKASRDFAFEHLIVVNP